MARLSAYSRNRTSRRDQFTPDPKEWTKVCGFCPSDAQIAKYYRISKETFYALMDRERYKQEQDPNYKSVYLDAYKLERAKMREGIAAAFVDNIVRRDVSTVIFGMKAYNGVIEEKDKQHISLKKYEVMFKTKQFLTAMAKEFDLTYEQLNKFANKYFKEIDLDKE